MDKTNRIFLILVLLLIILFGLLLWYSLSNKVFDHDLVQGSGNNNIPLQGNNYYFTQTATLNPSGRPTSFHAATVTQTFLPTETITPTVTLTPGEGEPLIIGHSVEGRPLEVFRFGSGQHALLMIAGIHGGYEWNTVALADQLIEYLRNKKELIPEDKTLYILRVLNPDGYVRDKGPDGRANANNVDINRNWDANWQANWTGSQCWNYRFITAGESPESEPETQALIKFILNKNVERLINYHSAALGIFPGGWPKDQNSMDLAYSLALVSPYSYPPIETDCQYTGQLIDWASAQSVAAVDVELRNHIDTDFEINLEILRVFLNFETE